MSSARAAGWPVACAWRCEPSLSTYLCIQHNQSNFEARTFLRPQTQGLLQISSMANQLRCALLTFVQGILLEAHYCRTTTWGSGIFHAIQPSQYNIGKHAEHVIRQLALRQVSRILVWQAQRYSCRIRQSINDALPDTHIKARFCMQSMTGLQTTFNQRIMHFGQ